MADDKDNPDKEYKGSSPLMAAAGRGMVENLVGSIGGLAVGATISAVTGGNMKTGATVGSWVGGLGGLAHGAYAGHNDATAAKADHAKLTAALERKNGELEIQKSFVQTLSDQRVEQKASPNKKPDL